MKQFIFSFFLFFQISVIAIAQNTFIKQYAGVNTTDDGSGICIIAASDDSYVFAGFNKELGVQSCLYVYKADTMGNLIWGKRISHASTTINISPSSILETSDSSYLITGAIGDYLTGSDIFWMKINRFGDIVWTKFYGSPSGDGLNVGKANQTLDGGLIIAGSMSTNYPATFIIVIKTDSNGNIQWVKRFGYAQYCYARDVEQNPDSTYKLFAFGGTSTCILNLEENGDLISSKIVSTMLGIKGYFFEKTFDGGYLVVGTTNVVSAFQDDLFILKTDSLDSILWMKSYSHPEVIIPYGLEQTTDSGMIVCFNKFFMKLNVDGDTVWTRGINFSLICSAAQDRSGNYVGTGTNYTIIPSRITLVKIDSSGSTLCSEARLNYLEATVNVQSNNLNITTGNNGFDPLNYSITISNLMDTYDFCTPLSVPTSKNENGILKGSIDAEGVSLKYTSERFLNLFVSVTDIQGRTLIQKQVEVEPGENKLFVQADVSPGVYIVTIFDSQKRQSLKLVKFD